MFEGSWSINLNMSKLGLVRLHFQGSPAPVPRTTLEKYSNVILSELRKKPRKEKALRDAVECQVNKQIRTLIHLFWSLRGTLKTSVPARSLLGD